MKGFGSRVREFEGRVKEAKAHIRTNKVQYGCGFNKIPSVVLLIGL
jgi:hypothetical protein